MPCVRPRVDDRECKQRSGLAKYLCWAGNHQQDCTRGRRKVLRCDEALHLRKHVWLQRGIQTSQD